MREFEIKPDLFKKLKKMSRKDKVAYEAVMKKIEEIVNSSNIEHYENLHYNMKDSKEVHIGHFVLVFGYDKTNDFVSFEDYDHHDKIFKR